MSWLASCVTLEEAVCFLFDVSCYFLMVYSFHYIFGKVDGVLLEQIKQGNCRIRNFFFNVPKLNRAENGKTKSQTVIIWF